MITHRMTLCGAVLVAIVALECTTVAQDFQDEAFESIQDEPAFADEVGQNIRPMDRGFETVERGVFQDDRASEYLFEAGGIQTFELRSKEEIQKSCKASYAKLSYDLLDVDGEHDGMLRPSQLLSYVHRAVNPTMDRLYDEEVALIEEATEKLRNKEGLNSHSISLLPGYLTRGKPLKAIMRLMEDLRILREELMLASERDTDLRRQLESPSMGVGYARIPGAEEERRIAEETVRATGGTVRGDEASGFD